MNNRERTLAVLNYQDYDRLPLVHFGYWTETLFQWAEEGNITLEEARAWADGNAIDLAITEKLGFDFNWACASFGANASLHPPLDLLRAGRVAPTPQDYPCKPSSTFPPTNSPLTKPCSLNAAN